ncbi:PP2C family protein-serine/threonine phosphatase [Tunturiibacter lichenicola]|uniref:PP2C family protein-serine/threonine phosphatase n=1 Tax=Tunturiibacter lichenicola TaxID=2051959 RepID=UPI0021B3CC3A|nr:PP2C family protein-serine/threonine phosphatase [Edaphobacter lichenicola]
MHAVDPQLTANQVLRIFHRDGLFLFLGAAFTTFGFISLALAFLGRKFNSMLLWLGLFAILYGLRMWLDSRLLALMIPPALISDNLRTAIRYLVPIPAFFYFEAAGFLPRLSGRRVAPLISLPFFCLFIGAFWFGPRHSFEQINNVLVILTLIALIIQSITRKQIDRDYVIVRAGILVFVVFALIDNIAGAFGHYPKKEPLAFAFFLGTLGYVAAKRSQARDQQFSDLQKELEIAQRIQTAILPSAYPKSDHFQVAARYVPMTSVAGDFYDFLVADPMQAGLLIADVSGHGVPAALIASMVKLAATSQRANAADPATLLSGMNTILCGNTQEQFVTAAYVYLDAESSTLRYSAAAHPPMLLLRAGKVVELIENGLMLAAFTFATYATAVYPLEPGDRLVLYTDGILEAANAQGEEFGSNRLCTLLTDSALLRAEEAADRIISSLQTWSKSQNDDLTVLICDYSLTKTVA